MSRSYLWTQLKARLQCVQTNPGKNYNWVFFPGGPGLGSESLNDLTKILKLPGSVWHLDLPGDGSNFVDVECFDQWPKALVEAVKALDNVILVAHSTGGMYALATPELQEVLIGLVLMDSAPDASWQQGFMEYVKNNPLPDVEKLQKLYSENQNNELLKKLTIASIPYFAKKNEGFSFLEYLPYNFQACEWSAQHFDETYKAKWIPDTLPTMIFAGDQDHITPLELFIKSKSFQHVNILMRTIKNAGHYSWIENPDEVITAFEDYCQFLEAVQK